MDSQFSMPTNSPVDPERLKVLLAYVTRIGDSLASSNRFGIYDEDDIRQEIYLLVMGAESQLDRSKLTGESSEYSFFYYFVKKRLLTLKRDKFRPANPKSAAMSSKINGAVSIREDHILLKDFYKLFEDYSDLIDLVDRAIPAAHRMSYLKLLEGHEIEYYELRKIISTMQSIIERNKDGGAQEG
jgi:hypothetical protein